MPNENPAGIKEMTAEAYAELLAKLQAYAEDKNAAEARATAAEAKVREAETQRNDVAARLVSLEADAKALLADKREREVSDVIASAVAAGKYAPGDEPKLRALAGKLGTDALREFVATVPDGAAGPRRALASGATMPVDGGDKTSVALQVIAKARETGKPIAQVAAEMGVTL